MIIKEIPLLEKTAEIEFDKPVFGASGIFEKTAGAPPFSSWATGEEIRKFLGTITKQQRKENIYILKNALSAGEFFSSNINADYFPVNALTNKGSEYGYETFLNANIFLHHQNKDPEKGIGKPVLSLWNPMMKRVELIVELSREKAKLQGAEGIITRIESNEFIPVSMGCRVPYDVCSICGHKSKTRADYCEHMRPPDHLVGIYGPNKILPDGRKIYVINTLPKFFDISFVFIGAERTAGSLAKLAEVGDSVCIGNICSTEKTAYMGSIGGAASATIGAAINKGIDIYKGYNKDPKLRPDYLVDSLEEHKEIEKKKRGILNRHEIVGSTTGLIGEAVGLSLLGLAGGPVAPVVGVLGGALAPVIGKVYGKDQFERKFKPKSRKELEQKYYEEGRDPFWKASSVKACCEECEKTATKKYGTILKSVPSHILSSNVAKVEQEEEDIPKDTLDSLSSFSLPDILGMTARNGIVLKPKEFQRVILLRSGHGDLADQMWNKNEVFSPSNEISSVPEFGFDSEKIRNLLNDIIPLRSSFARPIAIRITITKMQKDLPTETTVNNTLLSKISSAYNGYRAELLRNLAKIETFAESDPKLASIIGTDGLSDMFSKKSHPDIIIDANSAAYFLGAHLNVPLNVLQSLRDQLT